MIQESNEKPRQLNVASFPVEPGIEPQWIEQTLANSKHIKAVILLAYASGTTPSRLNGTIQKCSQSGIPVFLLSTNTGRQTGITRATYKPLHLAMQSGAIPIMKINVNALEQFRADLQDHIDAGMTGKQLAETIFHKYAYGPNEDLPLAEWETPDMQQSINENRFDIDVALRAFDSEAA